jgi:hypothetical protein
MWLNSCGVHICSSFLYVRFRSENGQGNIDFGGCHVHLTITMKREEAIKWNLSGLGSADPKQTDMSPIVQ